MTKLFSYLTILFWTSLSMIFGLFLFTNGFFLRRNARTEYNNCSISETDLFNFKDPVSIVKQCLKPQARIILLVVDALKYEFTVKFHDTASTFTFHRNKLPIIGEMIEKYPKNSKLLKFIADPPTTTMQRLKSITTGTLPTFIDIHNNFASDKIVEDNFVSLNRENGNIFMGDDTWIKLYPNNFLREYSVPSFDISDLDSVDLEVKDRIFDEIENTDWSLLIAHILGIDHCGHKHGMHHPEMLRKLNETNYFLQKLIEKINKDKRDTILFVIGDHGMTENGDHGGNEADEIEAAMFIYSNLPLIDVNTNFNIEKKITVNQIDIVPTISIILGIPIPFSNIGNLIIDAIPAKENMKNVLRDFILHSLWKNIFQMQNYIVTYSSESFLFDDNNLEKLKYMYNELMNNIQFIRTDSDFKNFVNKADKYFTFVRSKCYEVWIQFNPNLMSRGLILFFCAMFSFFIIITGLIGKRMYTIFESSFLKCTSLAVCISLWVTLCLYYSQIINDFENTTLFFSGLIPVLCFGILLIQNWDYISIKWFYETQQKKTLMNIFSRLILLTTVFGVFSNSYIIEENKILTYFLITLFCFLIYSIRSKNNTEITDKNGKGFGKLSKKTFYICTSLFLVFIICLIIRCSNYFWRQRNEQKYQQKDEQEYSFVVGKEGSIVSKDMEIFYVFIAIASLAFYITVIKIWLRNCGNLAGYSPIEILARFFPAIIVVTISCYWLLKLQRNIKLNPALSQRINSLPLIIYMLFTNAILLIFFQPLTVFLLPKEKTRISIYQDETSIPKLYQKMKNVLYKKKDEDESAMPTVFGLGTVYSACYILLSVFLCLIYALLLGFIITPSVILMNLVCVGLLYISAMHRIQSAKNLEELLYVPNPLILCWFLIAEYFFYATGHQPSFSTIHWDAGFIGIDGSLELYLFRSVLIGINTFGSYIILGVALPLLIFAPFTLRLVFPNLTKSTKVHWEDIQQGEFILFQNDIKFHSEVFRVAGKYILFHAVRVFACMLAATIHCRHLMVWTIFAPKLIFEGISFIITVISVLVSLLLLLRIESCIKKLITNIN